MCHIYRLFKVKIQVVWPPKTNSWTYSHRYHSYFLMWTIHTYIIHKLFVNLCNCRTTQCFTTQPCVKYPNFFKSKFRSYDPRRRPPKHIHISYHSYFLMRTIHTYVIHKLFINSCNCRTTQCYTTTRMVKYTDFFKSKFRSFDPRR